ncbi:MAG: DegT/DnrJ/EryC1/StrS family aminotransferase [Sphingobacteriaceae bacterium]|nr:MAG: DegT/DnrJ/EryC1/StrS family aminotransferase [Sphingobacteriaceae bacterium]
MINVTKTFLPPFDEYTAMLKKAWDKSWITNNGDLLRELEQKLKDYLQVKNLQLCSNGTVVLQMALKALNITGEVITTPFSYVATSTAILWERCTPVFVDINDTDFCIDASKIEAAITNKTQAILATHVYGHPCDVEAIEKIAVKHGLKVIYDAAHAFGTQYKGKSIFNYGDISTCSFHATKIFHMGEGGCTVTNNDELDNQLMLYRQFGHIGDEYFTIGINAKNSEFHAAMGLCNLKYIDQIFQGRKDKWLHYYSLLKSSNLQLLDIKKDVDYNYAYFPVIFSSEDGLLKAMADLKESQIFPRRYFYPSLNTLHYINGQSCPVSESVAKRVFCIPLYHDLTIAQQQQIVQIILNSQQ